MKIYPKKIIVKVLTIENSTFCFSPFEGWQQTYSHSIYSDQLLDVVYDLINCVVYTHCFLLKEVLIYSEQGILIDTISINEFLLEYIKELQQELVQLPLCQN